MATKNPFSLLDVATQWKEFAATHPKQHKYLIKVEMFWLFVPYLFTHFNLNAFNVYYNISYMCQIVVGHIAHEMLQFN